MEAKQLKCVEVREEERFQLVTLELGFEAAIAEDHFQCLFHGHYIWNRANG